ncbi:MAG: LytR C-terminal domain-containing protein [Ilumatobacteraceae bacterium]
MTNDQTGRTPRQTTGGAPAASTIMIVVTVIAVVIGFFILKRIRDDDGGSAVLRPPTESTVAASTTADPLASTTTVGAPTTTGLVVAGTSVQVANISTASGVAGSLTKELQGKGFTLGKATNGTGTKLATSVVFYDPANPSAQAVANSVATLMGGVAVQALPTPIPITNGTVDTGVGVVVMLGNDKAGKTLAQMAGSTAATTTVAGVATTKA